MMPSPGVDLQVVKDAVASGVEGYDADIRASVRKASQGLRLTKDAAMAIASKAVRFFSLPGPSLYTYLGLFL